MLCILRRYIHAGLHISRGEAARLREANLARVLGQRRLLLVLDLDHTLLNSTRLADVGPPLSEALHAAAAAPQAEDQRMLYFLPHMQVLLRGPRVWRLF